MTELINEHQILLETLLPTDWTWGCELEAYDRNRRGNPIDAYMNGDDDSDYYESDDDSDYYDSIYDMLMAELKNNCDNSLYDDKNSEVHSDCSLHPDSSYDVAFEWATPVFKSVPKAFEGFVHTLYNLIDSDIYTNNDCGFHHHLMYNGMNERDCIWIYCNLAMDTDFIENTKTMDDFSLYDNYYSSDSALYMIRKNIIQDNYVNILSYLSTDKFRLFRIHPSGTLEWRGPRDFLNRGSLEVIKKFYYNHLQKVIQKFIEYNRSTTLFGTNLSKEEFFNKLKEARKNFYDPKSFGNNEFIRNVQGEYKNKNKNPYNPQASIDKTTLMQKFEKKPYILAHLIDNDNPFLGSFFNLLTFNDIYFLKDICNDILVNKLTKLNSKEFSKRIVNHLLKAGFRIINLTEYGLISVLDYEIDKDIILNVINSNDAVEIRTSYLKKLIENTNYDITLGEIEKILLDNTVFFQTNYVKDSLMDDIANRFNREAVEKLCYFILKVCHQMDIYRLDLFKSLRESVKQYGSLEFKTKWNNAVLGLIVNKQVSFSACLLTITPNEFLRIETEFPGIQKFINDEILEKIPEKYKNILKQYGD